MGYGTDNKEINSYDRLMKRLTKNKLKNEIQAETDEFFNEAFNSLLNSPDSMQDDEKNADRISIIEKFVRQQLVVAEVYFPREIVKSRNKKPQLVITALPVLKDIFDDSMTKPFDIHLSESDKKADKDLPESDRDFWLRVGVYHKLDNLTQTAMKNVSEEIQNNFKKVQRKKAEQKHNVYYKEIEVDSDAPSP